MTERIKSFLAQFAIPALLLASAWGVIQYKVDKKEDASTHQLDMQASTAQSEKRDKELEERFNVLYNLVLDMRCEQKPNDRRCKGYTP